MKNFGLIGAAGYIAPRHMRAIRDSSNNLLAALDPNDSVGQIDSYFPEASFFTEFERFDRHVEKLRKLKTPIDFMSICSPNYLHDSHIRFSLRSGSDVICEKPLVLNSRNLDSLKIVENESGKKINTILQLRLHPAIKDLKKKVTSAKGKKFDVDLTYIAPRGLWYKYSWKGNIEKSGGIETNIGVHLFDMLHFVFGDVQINEIYLREQNKSSGYLEFQNARVRWYLSLDSNDLLQNDIRGAKTFRSIICNDEEIEFSDGFTDLHTECYKEILNGNGFGLEENRTAIETVSELRTAHLKTRSTAIHPFLKK